MIDRIILKFVTARQPPIFKYEDFDNSMIDNGLNPSLYLYNLKLNEAEKWIKIFDRGYVDYYNFEAHYNNEEPFLQFMGFPIFAKAIRDRKISLITDRFINLERSKVNFIKFQNELIDNGFEKLSMIDTTFMKELDIIYDK